MIIDHPRKADIPSLRALWKQAFGDADDFLDSFFTRGFAYDRCRCVLAEGEILAALYWFDCWLARQKLAYFYAIATEESRRGQGLCHLLMADTHANLLSRGYAGAVLLPAGEQLQSFYGTMGYLPFGQVRHATYCAAGKSWCRSIDPEEYALLRRERLPEGGIRQEGALLRFLASQAELYAGETFVAAVSREDPAMVMEFLGDDSEIPGFLGTLGVKRGNVRTPGPGEIAGMYLPLTADGPMPTYLGLPMD